MDTSCDVRYHYKKYQHRPVLYKSHSELTGAPVPMDL
jgi:hypothetical protein